MIFSKFIVLCTNQHNTVLEYVHHPSEIPCVCLQLIPVPTPSFRQLQIYFLSP